MRSSIVAAFSLAIACAPAPPSDSATEGAAASATSDDASASATDGATATSLATTSAATSGESSSGSGESSGGTGGSTGESTGGAIGCGDGVPEAGQICLDRVEHDVDAGDVVIGDLDEDGHLDLLTIAQFPCPAVEAGRWSAAAPGRPREGSSFFAITAGFGDGTGGLTFVEVPELGFGEMNDPTLGDFDGDGHLDLAVGDAYWDGMLHDEVGIALGDGLGGFSGSLSVALPFAARELEAGDLEGDGDLDLVVAGPDGLVVLENLGGGEFDVKILSVGPHSDPNLLDLDEDAGDLEIAVIDQAALTVELFEWQLALAYTWWEVGAVESLEDLAILAPAKGDRPALLVTSYSAGDRGYALHAKDQPLELFADEKVLLAEGVGRRVVVGEFDGAPRPDALVLSRDLHGLVGADPWPQPVNLVFEDDAFISQAIAVGDLNEDGLDDLAYAIGSLVLLLSNP